MQDPIRDAKAAAARGDFESAVSVLRPQAHAGNREAQYELAFLALTECDLFSAREAFKSPLSDQEAWRWLLRAAESGSVQAQYDAGASLATGDFRDSRLPQDVAAAVAWYRRAAEAGSPAAQFNLASMLAEGEGCERDLREARDWLKRSMAGGYEHAGELLGHLDSLK